MRSVLGRAVVVAGAVVVALGKLAVGAAAAKPLLPGLAFSPAPYNYGQVAAGQAASQTFTLANTGGQATGRLRVTLDRRGRVHPHRRNLPQPRARQEVHGHGTVRTRQVRDGHRHPDRRRHLASARPLPTR